MKKLMLTTALVAATATGAFAQTETATPETDMAQTGANVPAFLVSTFTGKNLFTLDTDEIRTLDEAGLTDDSVRWNSDETFAASRDAWDDVGNIDDVVLTKDGELRGVLLDIGGFLGIGARSVMVDMDELYFVADETTAEDLSDFSVVATLTREELENLPEWDGELLTTGFAASDANMTAEAPMDQTAAAIGGDDALEGYEPIPTAELTAERVLGANVYGMEGEDIATVDDLILDADGQITQAVMDVGGFIGVGTYTVALDIADIDVMWNAESEDVRAQVSMTQEELEALPEYEG